MNERLSKLAGWKVKKMGDVDFVQCPYCGHCSESFFLDKDSMAKCYKCKKGFHGDKLRTAILKKPVAICKICETEVSLTPENLEISGGYSYICPKCMNVVAFKFKNYLLQPQTVMKLKWNKSIKNRCVQIVDDLFFADCKDKKDLLILKVMQLMAKEENTGFLYFREEEHKAALVFSVEKEKYIGFIVWTENKNAILRQLFIIDDERRKGHGTKILKFWVENFANKINDKFGIESPNNKLNKLLVKLEYAKFDGEYIKGIKCFFVPSGC